MSTYTTMIQYVVSLAVAGTLVLVIPSRDGLVVVADSRTTVLGRNFDGIAKLQVARTKHPILVTITGTSDFADPPPSGISLEEWVPRATYQYRGTPFVQSFLEKRPDVLLSPLTATAAGLSLASSLNDYFNTRPAITFRFLGQELCRLVLCQSAANNSMLFASIALSVDDRGRVHTGTATFKNYNRRDHKAMEYIGEDRYTTEHVLGPNGAGLLDKRAADVWNLKSRIDDFRAIDAALLGEAIIRAAEATTRIVPVPSGNGIGGPVTVYLITPRKIAPILGR